MPFLGSRRLLSDPQTHRQPSRPEAVIAHLVLVRRRSPLTMTKASQPEQFSLREAEHHNSSLERSEMNLTNDSYVILICTKSSTERYYRDKTAG